MYNTTDIPIGAANAISRTDLKTIWNLSDRDMRDEVAAKRTEDDGTDYVIISSSGRVGYHRSDDEVEIRRMMAENEARIKSLKKANEIAQIKLDRKKLREGLAG